MKKIVMKISTSLVALLLISMAHAYSIGEGSFELRGNRNNRSRFVQQVNDKNTDPNFESPSFAPVSITAPSVAPNMVANPSSFVIELLEFKVSMEDSTYSQSVSKQLDTHLTSELSKTFSSLRSVDLLHTGTVTGLAALTVLAFSGTATFSGLVSADKVGKEQTRILQDSATMKEIAPKIVSISMSNAEAQFSPGGLIVVVIVSTIGFVAALLFGYRRYKLKQGQSSVEKSVDGDSTRKEVSPQDGLSHSGLIFCRNTEVDDYSIDDYSTLAESEVGHNVIQRHKRQEMSADDSSINLGSTTEYDTDQEIIQSYGRRDMHEDEYSVDVALSTDYDTDDDNSRMPVVTSVVRPRNARIPLQQQSGLLKSGRAKYSNDSDAEFSFSNVANKGMESDDDDVYTTDNEGPAAKAGSRTNVQGYFNMLGGKKDEDEDEFLEDEELAPTPFSPMQVKRPFDEASVELAAHKYGDLGTRAQLDYNGDGDDDDAEDYRMGRNRSNKGKDSVDAGRTGTGSSRQERRKDQHLARPTR